MEFPASSFRISKTSNLASLFPFLWTHGRTWYSVGADDGDLRRLPTHFRRSERRMGPTSLSSPAASVPLLHRDRIGIGGSWSEFVGYLVASMSSDNVKLVLQSLPEPLGPANAKLVAHKSKGMPLISVSLNRLVESSAGDAMANLSNQLFKVFKDKKSQFVREQERSYLLTKNLAAEQEKFASLQHQLDALRFSGKRKQQHSNALDKGFADSPDGLDTLPGSDKQQSTEKTSLQQDFNSLKVRKPVVSAYRRVKVRGAMLQDSEDKDA
ncbi:uncharacterized protein [Aristolochia californica]|uniref:uncharacterized protein isoform X1 n=1 Tax=Aristolochia californica TaxID=171875 RepID=UPI0035DA4018